MSTDRNEFDWGVIGHDWVVATLAQHISAKHIQHAYLFSGTSAIGKRTLAVAFARALLCTDPNAPCAKPNFCRSCMLINAGKHPDVRMFAPVVSGKVVKSAKIGVDSIRDLIRQFSLTPVESERRVAIISNFEAAGRAAADALLKTLEEPPGNGVIILTAENAADLPSTIVSRCAWMTLRPLPRTLVQQALSNRWKATSKQAEQLAHLSCGRIGWAIDLVTDNSALETRTEHLSELYSLLPATRVERFAYADELRKDPSALIAALDLWSCWWRDVMHIAAGATTSLTNADGGASARLAANQLTAAEAARAVTSVRTAQARLLQNSNARLTIEVLLLDMPCIKVA